METAQHHAVDTAAVVWRWLVEWWHRRRGSINGGFPNDDDSDEARKRKRESEPQTTNEGDPSDSTTAAMPSAKIPKRNNSTSKIFSSKSENATGAKKTESVCENSTVQGSSGSSVSVNGSMGSTNGLAADGRRTENGSEEERLQRLHRMVELRSAQAARYQRWVSAQRQSRKTPTGGQTSSAGNDGGGDEANIDGKEEEDSDVVFTGMKWTRFWGSKKANVVGGLALFQRCWEEQESSAFSVTSSNAVEGILSLRRDAQRPQDADWIKIMKADAAMETELLLAKEIKAKSEQLMFAELEKRRAIDDEFNHLFRTAVLRICRKVLPEVSFSALLKKHKADRSLNTRTIPNKELYALTDEDLDQCLATWGSVGRAEETLVKINGVEVRRKDIKTLAGLEWLNDEVVNLYVELLNERSKLPGFPKCYIFNSFMYEKLTEHGYNYGAVKRWTRKVNLFEYEKVLIPVHLGTHWTSAVIDMQRKRVTFYDSMGAPGRHHLEHIKRYLMDEHQDKLKKPLEWEAQGWQLVSPQANGVPQQRNCCDCGVFMCKILNCESQNIPFDFSQTDMPYFRKRLCLEILHTKIL